MKRAIAVAIALACAACGGDSSEPAQRAAATAARGGPGNEAPTIESAELTPDPATAADALTVELRAMDRERDRLTTSVEWYKNGELVEDLRDVVAPAGTFNRGDRVYATVTVADATHEPTTRLTPSLTIGNAAPRIESVEIAPSPAIATDLLEARVQVADPDGDSVELSYRWLKNGVEIPAATTARLPAGVGRRGDKIEVQVSASDGTDATPWTGTPVVYANAKPKITSQPGYEMGANGVYDYQVQAKDPDGDAPLRYELIRGPAGMTVDDATGLVTWTVPQDAKGNNPIEVAVSDPYGGRDTQTWVLSVDWNQPPASPSDNADKAAKPAAKQSESPEEGETGEATSDEESPAKPAVAKPAKKQPPAKVKPAEESDTESDQGEETEEEEF